MAKKKKKKNSSEEGASLGEGKKGLKNALDRDVKKSIIAVLLIMIALIFLLSLARQAGVVGEYIDRGLALIAGQGRYLLPIVMLVLGGMYLRKMEPIRYVLAAVGALIFWVLTLGLLHIFNDLEVMKTVAAAGEKSGFWNGGFVGFGVAFLLTKFLGKLAGGVILFGFALIGLMLIFNAPLNKLLGWLKLRWRQKREEKEEEKEKEAQTKNSPVTTGEKTTEKEKVKANIKMDSIRYVEGPRKEEYRPDPNDDELLEAMLEGSSSKREKENIFSFSQEGKWQKPKLKIFKKNQPRPHQDNINENIQIIKETLANFNIAVEPAEHSVGPTVTQYTFKPEVGVKLSRIVALQDNLALALAAQSIRIEAPIPGKSLVGVEVPNKKTSEVRLRSMLESDVYKNKPSALSVILGENVNGYPILANIEKMPHLLVAGATSGGKSVCINTILCTLLYENSPNDLQMILVDPKMVELSFYEDLPHLVYPVITDMPKVIGILKWAVGEMKRRYLMLKEVGSRDIQSYNNKVVSQSSEEKEKGEEKLKKIPFIVIVIDEMADLMAVHGREIEGLIARLAQMARAVGIHLILSTQRPSVNVITGLIKSNIVTRIAFKVGSQIDSRTILDRAGAEKLLGNGDMLFSSTDFPQPRRIQGVYVSEEEAKKLVREIKKQAERINFQKDQDLVESLKEQLEATEGGDEGGFFEEEGGGGDDEKMYEQAKELVISAGQGSTSMLQRRLRLGHSRAGRIIDMLEDRGVLGPANGPKPRELLISSEEKVDYADPEKDQSERESWEKEQN